jgi:hypothetical protein
MRRRLRWIVLAVVALLLIAAAAVLVTARPQLQDDRDRVDERWAALREPLTARYAALGTALVELQNAGGGEREVAADLERQLTRWNRLADDSAAAADAGAEVEAANALEGTAARLQAIVTSSARLNGVEPLLAAIQAFATTVPPEADVTAYNDAVEDYQHTRESLRNSLVAQVLDFEARATLVIPATDDQS